MNRVFKIVLIDDSDKTIKPIMESAKLTLSKRYGYEIDYSIISKSDEFAQINEYIADIVMFDYNLSGSDFSATGLSDYGDKLIKQYRKNNKRTKVVFYSSRFRADEDDMGLSVKDLLLLINELNVFKIIELSAALFVEAIISAIENIDTVLISFDELINTYGDDGMFVIDGVEMTGQALLNELKLGTQIGNAFREQVNLTILTYLMKFGGSDE